MTKKIAGALAMIFAAAAGQAAPLSPTDIVNRHVSSGGNVDAIMADYADDAVVLQAGKTFQGKAAIRPLFERMFAGHAPGAKPFGGMKVTRVWQEGNVGLLTWQAGPMNATEEFLVQDGKIKVQAIFMSHAPDAAAPR